MVQSSRKSWQREPKLGRRSARFAPKDVLPKEAEIIKEAVWAAGSPGDHMFWLVVAANPAEKWWSSSVGMDGNSQLNGKHMFETTNQITIMFPLLLVYSLLTTINHQPPTRIFSTNQWFSPVFGGPKHPQAVSPASRSAASSNCCMGRLQNSWRNGAFTRKLMKDWLANTWIYQQYVE